VVGLATVRKFPSLRRQLPLPATSTQSSRLLRQGTFPPFSPPFIPIDKPEAVHTHPPLPSGFPLTFLPCNSFAVTSQGSCPRLPSNSKETPFSRVSRMDVSPSGRTDGFFPVPVPSIGSPEKSAFPPSCFSFLNRARFFRIIITPAV